MAWVELLVVFYYDEYLLQKCVLKKILTLPQKLPPWPSSIVYFFLEGYRDES